MRGNETLAIQQSATDWKPIETAPKDGTRIAIKFASGREHEANWRSTYGGEWRCDASNHTFQRI